MPSALVKKLTLQRKIPILRLGHRTVRYDLAKVKAAIDKFEIKAVS